MKSYGVKPWTPEEEERLRLLISERLRDRMRSRSSCTAPFRQFTNELTACACPSSRIGKVRCTQMNSGLHFKIAVVALGTFAVVLAIGLILR